MVQQNITKLSVDYFGVIFLFLFSFFLSFINRWNEHTERERDGKLKKRINSFLYFIFPS